MAPSDEGAVTKGDWGRDLSLRLLLCNIHLPRQREVTPVFYSYYFKLNYSLYSVV